MTNIIGANFSCLPNACALSRSMIQEQTGGKTQVAGVITAGLIMIVLLWIGPFFEPLPKVHSCTTPKITKV
jgi:solute carrier family 26, other